MESKTKGKRHLTRAKVFDTRRKGQQDRQVSAKGKRNQSQWVGKTRGNWSFTRAKVCDIRGRGKLDQMVSTEGRGNES